MRDLNLIIFSKDRAAQLDLLLRSLRRFLIPGPPLRCRVLYASSDGDFSRGYDLLRRIHGDLAEFVPQSDFRADLLSLLDDASRFTMFLVDDDVFIAPFSLDAAEIAVFDRDVDVACLSLRMHPGISRCYTQAKATPAPPMSAGGRWRWRGLSGDWGYPMSLDAHLFRSGDLIPAVRDLPFANPNSLECALAGRPPLAPTMACFSRPRVINIPANRVQQTAPNRHMGLDPAPFNERFLAGGRLDLDAVISGHTGEAVHQEMDLIFIPPAAAATQTADESRYAGHLGLLIEYGIGDVLTSFAALRWLRMAYPGRPFVALLWSDSPHRLAGMKNVAESHPLIEAVETVDRIDDIARRFPGLEFINISPWHFLNRHTREMYAKLDYVLTPDDLAVAKRQLAALPAAPVVLQPVASKPAVNWPIASWQRLIHLLAERFPVVLVGGPDETRLDGALDLRGALTVRETMAVALRSCAAVTARSFLSIVTTDARVPTLIMTPTDRLHELDYAYPPSYFQGGTARLLNNAATAERALAVLEKCMYAAAPTTGALSP